MVEFSNRRSELGLLESKYARLEKGELVILYGRRRVGKTELVLQFLKKIPEKEKLYFLIDEGTPSAMLSGIAEDIARQWHGETPAFHSWDEFFGYLEGKSERTKLAVAIDEFQRMHTDPRAFSRLQKAWDTMLRNRRMLIVLLGSAIGAIHKIAIGSRSPLFGRATWRYQIEPFDYQAFREALPPTDEALLVTLYATFGGMPHYLRFAEEIVKGRDYLDAVEEHILKKSGLLRDEPQALLRMELKDTGRYNSILSAIADGHLKLTEISAQTGISPAGLNFYITRLQHSLRLIEKIEPVCGKKRLSKYVFTDNFFRFWYRFVAKNLSSLEIEDYAFARKKIEAELPAFTGPVFESIVRELIAKYNRRRIKGFPIEVEKLGGWWSRTGNEVDVCGVSKNGLLLGEVKWQNKPADFDVVSNLLEMKKHIQCTPAQAQHTRFLVVSKSGFTPAALSLMREHGVLGLELKDVSALFNALEKK
ncbi:MAG: ATP-binding protein [Candidatus Micrarchaeia archaeon]